MSDIVESTYRSIANPRRTTLMSLSAAEAAAPPSPVTDNTLKMLVDDGAVCVDGVCALPE